mmetsp:Transcript_3755/g.10894  ORF Transcript_3755/g.10894 Transcript_3755/m.10894 type:complete len:408 (-) Transcript_3755:131-1354(-)|eukprot:CAMPEP_0176012152 /NCGR_PEP_ID=MMETSP0120_2-20121206/5649_1 /TAXON_ID=160619 /ORGANISM="Kryptoperidinium foliaceum, Strain CCMP 1326" /LENGTH=407 /DNA_ID=CAMNT_0017345031 /DNA_START=27 /DNA_END=1250 /DNA_ORIENTATION=+
MRSGLGAPSSSDNFDAVYTPVAVTSIIAQLETKFWQHSVLKWLIVPVYVAVVSVAIPFLRPTCANGINFWALLPIAPVLLHHLHVESVAWNCVKSVTTPPEVCILRQLGELRKRRGLLILGVLESLDLYIDLMFPAVAFACDAIVTDPWVEMCRHSPVTRNIIPQVVKVLHFGGCAVLICLTTIFCHGIAGIFDIRSRKVHENSLVNYQSGEAPRISAQVYVAWARSAATAGLPSVANFCEAMANQRRWVFGQKDAKTRTDGRKRLAFGKITKEEMNDMQLADSEEQARIRRSMHDHSIKMLVVHVLLGNILQLFVQSSFFMLTFEHNTPRARGQLIVSLAVSSTVALFRSGRLALRMGWSGIAPGLLCLGCVAWVVAKVVFAYKCEDHLWNLTSGCVSSPASGRSS